MPSRASGRPPPSVLKRVHRGQIKASTLKAEVELDKMRPDRNYGLGVAKVMVIDYEDFVVTLRTLTGVSETHDRVPIPLTVPGAGKRHFFGAMPEVGDYCVVGWAPQETASPEGGSKIPVILSWVVPGPWMGREWVTGADFEIDEYDFDSSTDQEFVKGVHDRTRFKLRHMQPGNIVASSSQGADLVLDEGVTLANRRGNEFRLRDQDQAAVLRALQSFQALAGARTYAGMVQRDALFLNPMMVSDGYEWDGPLQSFQSHPLDEIELPVDSTAPKDFLTPARILRKKSKGTSDEGYVGRSVIPMGENIDPYVFLRHGGYITDAGFVVDGSWEADAAYGGKPIFRVAAQSSENGAILPNAPTLTEHRIEVAHTSDGRLPVTEQTDLFDAERLPETDPTTGSPVDFPPNWPFMEFVMGSVVGNDAFTQQGRQQYGLPLVAEIFDGEQGNPRLTAAKLVTEDAPLTPTPLKYQLASLFRMTPPIPGGGTPTFWGVNKAGQLRASIGGDPKENSVEAYLKGGMKLGMAGRLDLILGSQLSLGSLSKEGVKIQAGSGAVVIEGSGPITGSEATTSRMTGTENGEGDLPAVDIKSRTNTRMQAEKKIKIKSNDLHAEASNTIVNGLQNLDLKGGESIQVSTKCYQSNINGRSQESWSGPKNNLPTNGPLHSRDYSPTIPTQVAEKITFNSGHREEKFVAGDHTTEIVVGDLTHSLLAGTWKASAVTSSMKMDAQGIKGDATAGTVKLAAAAGAASMSGLTGVTVKSMAGTAKMQSTQQINLAAPIVGPDQGAIICEGSLEPFTNKPFSTWGLGAKKHLIVAG